MFDLYKHLLNRKIIFGTTIGAALFFMVTGVIFWGGFNTTLEETNNMNFCISCHEMEDNIYQEYKLSIHYKNRSGVRTTCSDCHVPREWKHMLVRKISASSELFHKVIGSVDTAEKFNAKRLELAQRVWFSMQETDSRECRNCHSFIAMDLVKQQSRSQTLHAMAQERNKTCIDCHKGIAHKLPDEYELSRGGSDDDHVYYEQKKIPCYQCHKGMQKPDLSDW